MSKNYQNEVVGLLKNTDDIHLVAGLAAEAGEVCGIYQKASYKDLPVDKVHLKEELGDVLFYTAAIAAKNGYTLDELMTENITKLKKRHNKGA